MQNNDSIFDLAVIGAGPGGYAAAIRAAQYGLRTAVIERGLVGGTCLNRGCIPTKTLAHASKLYREMLHSAHFGILSDGVSVDPQRLYARKNQVVERLRSGVEGLLKSNKIELFKAEAKILAQGAIALSGGTKIECKNILIAAGAKPFLPPIPGVDLPGVVTSDSLLEMPEKLPESLIIIGGGVIGTEFAAVFGGLGCEVTIIEAEDSILPAFDTDVCKDMTAILKKRGIKAHTSAKVERIEQAGSGLTCHFTAKGRQLAQTAQTVLVSTGRIADTAGLFSDDLAVQFNRGIVVDEHFRTSVPGIYAIGDVISGGIQLAHAAAAQGLCAAAHIAGRRCETDLSVIPSCVYTDPEIACAGLTEKQADDREIPVKIGRFSMMGNGKSLIEAQDRGFVKLIFHADSGALLGAHIMCARATDMISELASAIARGAVAEQLAAAVRAHPTFSEGVTEAAEAVFGMAIHVPKAAK